MVEHDLVQSAMNPQTGLDTSDKSATLEQANATTHNNVDDCVDKSKIRACIDFVVWFAQDQWFLILMGILISIASQVQVPRSQQEPKTGVVSYLAVSIIFFLNGCAIPTKVFLENLLRWQMHLFVQVQSFVMVSAIAFGVMSATASNPSFLNAELLLGILVVGSLPTAIGINTIITRKANGNSALTLTQSALGNIFGCFLSTALIRLYTSVDAWYNKGLPKSSGYDELYRRVFKQLGLSVFVPLVVGQIVLNVFPATVKKILYQYKLMKISSLALLVIIWQTYDEAFASSAFSGIPASNIVFVVFIEISLFLLWLGIAFFASFFWLSPEDTIAVSYTVATKTPAIGVPLIGVMFAGLGAPQLARIRIATVFYQALQAACSSLLSIPLRKWQARAQKRREAAPAPV